MIGTHGRSFWILDDVTPLRELRNWGLGDWGLGGQLPHEPRFRFPIPDSQPVPTVSSATSHQNPVQPMARHSASA